MKSGRDEKTLSDVKFNRQGSLALRINEIYIMGHSNKWYIYMYMYLSRDNLRKYNNVNNKNNHSIQIYTFTKNQQQCYR